MLIFEKSLISKTNKTNLDQGMSSSKPAAKPKTSITKKTLPSTTSSSRKPSAPKNTADSKAASPNNADKIDSPIKNGPSQFKDFLKLASESGLEIHTAPDFNSSGMSLIEMLENENNKEGFQVIISLFTFSI